MLLDGSCSSQSTTKTGRAPHRASPGVADWWNSGLWNATVRGFVTLDGRPVTYFGVTVLRDHTRLLFHPNPPVHIHAEDGRFNVRVPQSGEWDVVISGPGFAREVVDNVGIGAGYANTPLKIAVSRGNTIRGTVKDSSSLPVSGATVSIVQSSATPTGDVLWELARGNLTTVTDSNGNYHIEGVTSVSGNGYISATKLPDGVSLPKQLPTTDTSVELVLSPIGVIDGIVAGTVNTVMIVAEPVTDPQARLFTSIDRNGTFRFENIPIGDYTIRVYQRSQWEKFLRVSVLAGQTTKVTLGGP
jgi:hypothetical protein